MRGEKNEGGRRAMRVRVLIQSRRLLLLGMVVSAGLNSRVGGAEMGWQLDAGTFRHYVEDFNRRDQELYGGAISNAVAWEFLKANIPWFECPDENLQEIYYFRWWTYRKHVRETPAGFIVDEFLPPVPWAGKYNSISCAAGHHLYEGRWIREGKYLDDYSRFWFRGGGDPRRYSFWAADAVWARYCVNGDARLPRDLLPDLVSNFEAWDRSRRDTNGLYWQEDGQDGMEVSIGGSGYRPTINSYQYGDAVAISRIAELAGNGDLARKFREKADVIKTLVEKKLWDPQTQFFKVLPRGVSSATVTVREELGYTPWYFNLPDPQYTVAWKQVMDPQGFFAPFGPTTAEQRCPGFTVAYSGHECQWNGPSWPYATAVTLTALANVLNGPAQPVITASDYFTLLKIYARSHSLRRAEGEVVPWIDENLNPTNGDWLSRTRLKTWKNGGWDPDKGGEERGKDYNHSSFCDLIITGLVGLRPRADDILEVNPLAPKTWDYFCLDRVTYHGRALTIRWDRTGERYGRGKGLYVLVDGRQIAFSEQLERVTVPLPAEEKPETAGGWVKYDRNPIIGGKYGTCFDVSVLREEGRYRMWLSWRPEKSVALVESRDGFSWSEPPRIVVGPKPETGWEDDINRPIVLKREDGYHLWYTGQAGEHSAIGYATSRDGLEWKRLSDQPVLKPEQAWEKVAVMCPHVLWDAQARLFRMWYSGGEQNEPNAIGYATSRDGLTWAKSAMNPIFTPDPSHSWEAHKVTACQVEHLGDWYVMFYIGFRDEPHAQIGLARSRDGVTDWQRHWANPIVRPGANRWDHDACYKPYAIFDGDKWLLWYNGRHGGLEQIGVVLHKGEDLGFR